MCFSDQDVSKLQDSVKNKLSEKRFSHTLAVANTALLLSDYFLPAKKNAVIAAALLHDIAKEIPISEQIELLEKSGVLLTDLEKKSEGIIHSYTAPVIIKRDYPLFATEEILSAVYNHTTGAPDMSVFDEIIFLADFIEQTRKYEPCVLLRNEVLMGLVPQRTEDNLLLLHKACIFEIDATIKELIAKGRIINPKTVLTRNALLSKI